MKIQTPVAENLNSRQSNEIVAYLERENVSSIGMLRMNEHWFLKGETQGILKVALMLNVNRKAALQLARDAKFSTII